MSRTISRLSCKQSRLPLDPRFALILRILVYVCVCKREHVISSVNKFHYRWRCAPNRFMNLCSVRSARAYSVPTLRRLRCCTRAMVNNCLRITQLEVHVNFAEGNRLDSSMQVGVKFHSIVKPADDDGSSPCN